MPLIEEEIDGLSGLLFPFYDADTHMLYLAGKVVKDWGVGSAGAACWPTIVPLLLPYPLRRAKLTSLVVSLTLFDRNPPSGLILILTEVSVTDSSLRGALGWGGHRDKAQSLKCRAQ